MDDLYIGIDLGGTTIKFGLINNDGLVKEQWHIKTNSDNLGEQILPDIINSIEKHLLKSENRNSIKAIGMGSPGSINSIKGTVSGAYNLNWTTEQPLKERIESAFKIPFFVDNDANVAALGELWMGAGEKSSDVVFVTLGTGIGGGIIANGHLIHGIAGSGGEIGHIIVEPNGYLCTCGNRGCLETIASAPGIARIAGEISRKDHNGKLAQASRKEAIDAKVVFDLAKANDASALKVVDQVTYYLALGLGQVADLLNPKYIIIGGGVSESGTFLIDHINKYFPNFVFPNVRETTSLRLAKLGNSAGILGAAYLAKIGLQQKRGNI